MSHHLTQAEAERLHREAEFFQNAPPPAFHGSQQFSYAPRDSHTPNPVSEAALLPPLRHIRRTPALFTSSNHTSFPDGYYSTIGYPSHNPDLKSEKYGLEWGGWLDPEDDAGEEPVKPKRVCAASFPSSPSVLHLSPPFFLKRAFADRYLQAS